MDKKSKIPTYPKDPCRLVELVYTTPEEDIGKTLISLPRFTSNAESFHSVNH